MQTHWVHVEQPAHNLLRLLVAHEPKLLIHRIIFKALLEASL